MAVVVSYPLAQPKLADLLLGTEVYDVVTNLPIEGSRTSNFSLSSIAALITPLVPGGGTVTSVIPQANGVDGTDITQAGYINLIGTGGTTTSISGDTITINSTIGTITSVTSQAAGTASTLTSTPTGSVTDIALTFNGTSADYIDGEGNYIALTTLPQRNLQQVTDAGSTTTNAITVNAVTATQTTGLPPLVVTSTTLVPNLYVDRAVLSDTSTTTITNADLTGMVTSIGNATTVITNADLAGMVTSSGNTTTVVTNADLSGMVTSSGNTTTVVTNADLTGEVTSSGNATTVLNAAVIDKVLTGYTSGAGIIVATDNILEAVQKLDGNNETNANLTGMVTSIGNATTVVTNADITGEVTTTGNVAVVPNATVINKVLTGYVSAAGTVAATDNILEAIEKLDGNASTNADLTGMVTSVGNDTTVVTNADLTGGVTSTGNATSVITNADLTGEVISTGNATTVPNSTVINKVLTGYVSGAGSITATDNILEAIEKLDGNNATNADLTGMVTSTGNATTVVTNANLNGEVTSTGNTTVVPNATVIDKVLTGYTSGAGTVAATDNILEAIQKIDGNSTTNANLTGMVTSVGNATTVVTNANLTGGVTSTGNAATVITNANLTGPITSSGNATSIASQTGTGTKFVVDTSPTLVTPNIGAATGDSLSITNNVSGGTGSFTGQVTIPAVPTVNTDATSKQYVDNKVAGALIYKGIWNASTNSPALASGVGTIGSYYIVSTSGNTNLDGITDWVTGDWAVFSDLPTDAWQKIDNTSVLGGAGTGGKISKWSGSGTSVTLSDSVMTETSGDISVAGDITADNLSNTNTGDQTLSELGGVAANSAITGGTHTKITYDTKGLVTDGVDATTTDIAEGTNLYYTEARVDANANVTANTAKVTNVTTDLGTTLSATTVIITSSDGTPATIASADTTNAGILTKGLYDNIITNNAKVSDVNHNVTTNLGITGTTGAREITSSDGTPATVPVATTSVSGVMSTTIFDEHVVNNAKVSYPGPQSLAGYLPLTAGASKLITGTLYMSETVNLISSLNSTNTTGGYMLMQATGTPKGMVGFGSSVFTGLTLNDFGIRSQGNLVLASNGATVGLTIDTSQNTTLTGSLAGTSATFSASVSASGNSNSFGNTTTAALSTSSISSTGSLSISGNSNSIGATTFSGNVTVGTGIIKASIGGDISITQGSIGLRLNDAASAISPTTATSNNDNAVDLGVSNIRFRNLYMGGSGTFGGALTGTSASFSGSIGIGSTAGLAKLNITKDNTSGNALEILNSGSSRSLDINHNADGTGTTDDIVRISNNSVRKVTIDNAGNTTFTGALTGTSASFSGNVEVRSGNKLILQRPNNGVASEISTDSTGGMILNSINGEGFDFQNGGTSQVLISGTGQLTAANRLTLSGISSTQAGWILTTETNTGTGRLGIQAGGGSASYGGSIFLYAHSHATHPGDVVAGISSGSGGSFRVNTTGTDTGTTMFSVSDGDSYFAGDLGIGTTSPDAKLNVSKTSFSTTFTSADSYIRIGKGENATNGYQFIGFGYNNGAADQVPAYIGFQQTGTPGNYTKGALVFGTRNVTTNTAPTERMRIDSSGRVDISNIGVPTLRLNNTDTSLTTQTLGSLEFNQNDGSGNGAGPVCRINAVNESSFQGQASLTFQTGTSADITERMRINSAGNVGIGTDSPSFKLHTNQDLVGSSLGYLQGTSASFDTATNLGVTHTSTALGTGTAAGLYLANNANNVDAPSPIIAFSAKSAAGNHNNTYAAIYGVKTGSGTDANWNIGDLVFSTSIGTGANERMRIDSSGNVGIGTSTPQSALSVTGAVNNAVQGVAGVEMGVFTSGANKYAAIEMTGSAGRSSWIDFKSSSSANSDYSERIRGGAGALEFDTNHVRALTIASDGVSTFTNTIKTGFSSTAGQIYITSADTLSSPAIRIRQTNANSQGWDFDTENVSVGRLDIYSVENGNARTNRLSIKKADGNVGIGTDDPTSKLHVFGGSADTELKVTSNDNYISRIGLYEEKAGVLHGGFMQYKGNDGDKLQLGTMNSGTDTVHLSFNDISSAATFSSSITAAGDITAFSDERLKSDIKTITKALDKVNNLRGVTFEKDGVRGLGVIAQEVEKVIPEVVKDNEEYKSVAYGNIVGVLIEAIKELKAEVDELKSRL